MLILACMIHMSILYIINTYIYIYSTCMTLLKMFCAPFDRDETALFNNRRSHYQNRLFKIRCRLCKINLFGTLFFLCIEDAHAQTHVCRLRFFFRFYFLRYLLLTSILQHSFPKVLHDDPAKPSGDHPVDFCQDLRKEINASSKVSRSIPAPVRRCVRTW